MDEVADRRRREILVFEIAGRRHGLPVSVVRELLRAVTIVPMPQAPMPVEGIINLRGTIVTVLDIRARLRLPAKPAEPSDHLLVVEIDGRPVAIRIDHALELTTLDTTEVDCAGGLLAPTGEIAEVAKLPDGLMLMLDPRSWLSPAEADALASAPSAPDPEGGRS